MQSLILVPMERLMSLRDSHWKKERLQLLGNLEFLFRQAGFTCIKISDESIETDQGVVRLSDVRHGDGDWSIVLHDTKSLDLRPVDVGYLAHYIPRICIEEDGIFSPAKE